jgi:hypothetical protein
MSTNTQTDKWVPDGDVSETSTETTAPIVDSDRIADPQIPTLVLPKPPVLQSRVVPVAAPIDDAEPDKKPYPENYIECITILKVMRGMLMATRNQEQKLGFIRRIVELSNHVNLLQSGPKPMPLDNNKENAERGRFLSSRRQQHAKRRENLIAADANIFWPIIPEKSLPGIYIAALTEPLIMQAIDAARKSSRDFEVAWLDAYTFLAPTIIKKEHRLKLQSNPSADEMAEIEMEANYMNGEHFSTLARIKCNELRKIHNESRRPAIRSVLTLVRNFVESAKQQIIGEEKKFCATHSVPYSPTAASKKFDPQLAELDHALKQLDFVSQTPGLAIGNTAPAIETALQTIFGIPVVPKQEAAQ